MFQFLLHNNKDVTRGARGTIPRAPNHCGGPKSHNNIISTYFQNSTFASERPKKFERGDAKLVSCPRRHLTSLPLLHITIV